VAQRGGLRRGDLALIDKTQLGEKLDGVLAGATGHALDAFLTGHGLQRHRHQRAEAFILHVGVHRHKADGGFIIGIDIQPAHGHRFAAFIHHHLVMRQRIPGVPLGAFRLMQGFTQHFPAKLIVAFQLFFRLGYAKMIHRWTLSCCQGPRR